ncbi:MAG: PHP domain-containing protein [Xanthomonadaceae bacterium]|nr:PHP domain-containing protein [Xanthomonadaceae bacterium]
MFLADFHIHSKFSDGQMAIPEIVDFYGSRGFGAIAITDHLCELNTFIGTAARYLESTLTPAIFPFYIEMMKSEKQRAWDQYKMILITGVELSKNNILNSRSAHILGLGVTDWISADDDVADIARAIRAQGALAIAAHPVSTRKIEKQTYHLWDRREELTPMIDAWEVASGPFLFDEVADSKLPLIANSDLHRPSQIKAWKTVLDCERHEGAILEAIRKQKISFKMYEDDITNYGNNHHRRSTLLYRISPIITGNLGAA